MMERKEQLIYYKYGLNNLKRNNMTQKEKASELVDKFYQTTPNEAWINEPLGISKEYKAWEQAKQCALIAVDEILNSRPAITDSQVEYNEYWQEVKQEIEKL
jgi:hypothetical protein